MSDKYESVIHVERSKAGGRYRGWLIYNNGRVIVGIGPKDSKQREIHIQETVYRQFEVEAVI